MMRVLCLDLAYRHIGVCFGVIEQGIFTPEKVSIINTPPRKTKKNISGTDFEDCQKISRQIKRAVKGQDLVIFELPGGSQSARAARVLGYTIGIMSTLPKVKHVSPTEVKKVVKSRATKDEIIRWVLQRHPNLEGWDKIKNSEKEHVADAVAVGHAWVNKKRS